MTVFRFRKFTVDDARCGMKICSDSVLLAAWTFDTMPREMRSRDVLRVVDVGAGSGVLSLLAASELDNADIVALELNHDACADAADNFGRSEWAARLKSVEGDFRLYSPLHKIDLLISNPPYFATGERSSVNVRAAARHEETLTYGNLLEYASWTVADNGYAAFISPADRYDEIIFASEMNRLKLRSLCRVRTSQRKPATRILWMVSPTDGPVRETELSLRDEGGAYSAEYLRLVEHYYEKI